MQTYCERRKKSLDGTFKGKDGTCRERVDGKGKVSIGDIGLIWKNSLPNLFSL